MCVGAGEKLPMKQNVCGTTFAFHLFVIKTYVSFAPTWLKMTEIFQELSSCIDEHLLTLLERSKGSGITLDFWFPPFPEFCKALGIVSKYSTDITTLIYSTAEDEGDETNFIDILQRVTFPNLHHLSIDCPENSKKLLEGLLDLLNRSLDSGLELNLNCSPDEMIELLQYHPVSKRLKNLSVEFGETVLYVR
jgi:hypothetical protein